jgi:hypothetical protein
LKQQIHQTRSHPLEMTPEEQARKNLVASHGYCLLNLNLPSIIQTQVLQRNWNELDQTIRIETLAGGILFDQLQKFETFSEIEFIISIRSSNEEPDDDGIWHDDGSRILAFSLSLTLDCPSLEGGKLEIRRRTRQPGVSQLIPTPPFGTLIVFATGHQGFEHKINRVQKGERIIIAGWCT